MQRQVFSLIAPFLFGAGSLCGQQAAIEGAVLDPSGSPIPNARIECAGKSTLTDSAGHFALPGIARCQAVLSAAGFSDKRVELAAGDTREIALDIAGVAERVVVSATRTETSLEEAGAAGAVITANDLARRDYPALSDMLRDVPGVQIARYGPPGSLTEIFTRGSQRTGTLVLVDGVPVNDPGGELNLAGLSTSSLDRIEIVRGPESALFGAEAASGVVQLFTRRGDPERKLPRGSVSYERGSFQTDRWIAALDGGSGERFDYALGAEQFHTAGEYTNNYFRNTTGSANVGFRLAPETQVRGVFRTFDAILGTPNQVAYGIVDHDANEATRDTLVGVKLDDVRGSSYTQQIGFGYHRLHDLFLDLAPDGPFTVAGILRTTGGPVPRTYLAGLVSPLTPGATVNTIDWLQWPSGRYLNVTERKNFEYQGTLAQPGGALVFGYEYERQGGTISGSDVERDNHGLFVHKQQVIAGRVFLSGGVRFERNSVFGSKIAPRAAASVRVAGSTYLRASASRGITEPTLVQNFSKEFYAVGNPNLRPEKTTSYDAGIVQELLGRRLRAEVSVFDNSFRDLIAYLYPSWQNIEASRARGIEFSAQGRFAKYATLAGSYTYMRTRVISSSAPSSPVTGVGQELPRRPGNSGALSLSVAPRRWSFQTGAILVGERQDTDGGVFGVTRNPGYQNVYASGSFQLNRHAAPYLRADNLLNSRYQEVLGYPALSRSVYGGLRLSW